GGVFTSLQSQQGGYYSGSVTHWGPEINCGRMLYRAGLRNFGIIKCSRGGGGNSFWSKTATDHHMYTKVVETVNAATATLTGAGDTFEIAGLLYLQGESDSTAEAAIADTRIKELTDNLRADLPNASAMHCIIGGIARPGATSDTVRAKQALAGSTYSYIDYFSNLDLQASTAPDNLHFNKTAKLTIGERYAQAFFAANIVSRQYGKLVFIGDSITQGGNGDHPSYRYQVFKRLAEKGVPINATTGYKFTGSQTGTYANSSITAPAVNGQTFENIHDGHFGWRTFWENARIALPAGRYNTNNLGNGSLLNWTGQSLTYATADAGTLPYTGTTHTPDTVSIMIGINDLADGVAATQVRDDIGTLIDQLRASNPNVRIHLNRVLHTNQGAIRDTQVNTLNSLLPALVTTKNAASATSPVWLIDADTGFDPVTQTYDSVHPNAAGEIYVGDRIAAALGLMETPAASAPGGPAVPPHLESGSGAFNSKFEGNEIWNGSAFVNGWAQVGTPNKTVVDTSDLKMVNPGAGGTWLEGTNSGWTTGNSGNWSFETRLKFTANANGFIIWLGTGSQKVFVEVYGDHTQDNGNNTFSVAHNNLDGQFHTFRIDHDSGNSVYHVWRDGVRLTPVAGVAYDGAGAESRLIMGDYTSGTFGNNFDVTIDYVRYDQTAAYLPTGADADNDGLPDSWEFAFYNTGGTYAQIVAALTSAVASADDDGDGMTNLQEYIANTSPINPTSVLKIDSCGFVATSFQVSLITSPQRNYTLYRSLNSDLVSPWTVVDGPTIGTDGSLVLQDTNPPETRGFYQVGVTIP
ncbi:MAG: sialate O-acetylesterase, partial [Paracoccaceae bacterium]